MPPVSRAARAMGEAQAGHPMRERQRMVRYTIVGIAGFGIDAGILSLIIYTSSAGPYIARGPSFLAAVTVTWALNRRTTFDSISHLIPKVEYRRYVWVQVIGAVTNLGVYATAIAVVPWFAVVPVIPLALGGGVALIMNFGLSRIYVFPRGK